MAQLKKFMFDNFVIETRPEADEPEPPVDEETAAEPVSPTEQEENVRPKVRQKRQPNRNSRLNPSRKSNLNRRRKNLFPSRCPRQKKAIPKAKLTKWSIRPGRRATSRDSAVLRTA